MGARAVRTSGRSASEADRLDARLSEGLALLGIEANTAEQQALIDFLALLAKWNATYNLTSVRDPNDMLSVHLLDSLSILPLVDRAAPGLVLDVGSGAGLPAIPLAILRPNLAIHSVDAVAKKVGFQLQARSALGLDNLVPHHARIERFVSSGLFSLVVTRAYGAIAPMLRSIDSLVTGDATVIAMKGADPSAEVDAVVPPWSVDRVVPIEVPFLGARRCAVVVSRQG